MGSDYLKLQDVHEKVIKLYCEYLANKEYNDKTREERSLLEKISRLELMMVDIEDLDEVKHMEKYKEKRSQLIKDCIFLADIILADFKHDIKSGKLHKNDEFTIKKAEQAYKSYKELKKLGKETERKRLVKPRKAKSAFRTGASQGKDVIKNMNRMTETAVKRFQK